MWMQIPDVPRLVDCSTVVGVLDELDSAIIITLYDPVRTFVPWRTIVFSVHGLFNPDHVIDLVGMRNPFGILSFVVMEDNLLFSLL